MAARGGRSCPANVGKGTADAEGAAAGTGSAGRPPPDENGRKLVKPADFPKRKDLVDFLKERGYVSQGLKGSHERFFNTKLNYSVIVPKNCDGITKKGLVSSILDDVFGLSSGGQK